MLNQLSRIQYLATMPYWRVYLPMFLGFLLLVLKGNFLWIDKHFFTPEIALMLIFFGMTNMLILFQTFAREITSLQARVQALETK